MKDRVLLLICCLYLLLSASRLHAQNFSANLVTRGTRGITQAKFNSSKGRVRLEVRAGQNGSNSGPLITLWWVNEKMWISSGKEKPDSDAVMVNGLKMAYFIFHPRDAGDLCGQYVEESGRRAKARNPNDISTAKLVCREVGAETLDGRDTRKIAIGNSVNGEPPETEITLWIAPSLHSVVKMAKTESEFSMQLENIKESAQAEELFQIPAGASRVD